MQKNKKRNVAAYMAFVIAGALTYRAFVIASRNDSPKRNGMTVPRTLAVVLNPASGLEKVESRMYHAVPQGTILY